MTIYILLLKENAKSKLETNLEIDLKKDKFDSLMLERTLEKSVCSMAASDLQLLFL